MTLTPGKTGGFLYKKTAAVIILTTAILIHDPRRNQALINPFALPL